jgi:hypothetical protein
MRIPLELSAILVAAGLTAAFYQFRPRTRYATHCGSCLGSALAGDEAVLRNAIDYYSKEHDGAFPGLDTVVGQLTLYTDVVGNTSPTRDSVYTLGPYLRAIPRMPLGANCGLATISSVETLGVAWVYDDHTGAIRGNYDHSLIR